MKPLPLALPSLGNTPSLDAAISEKRRRTLVDDFARLVYGHTPAGGRIGAVNEISRRIALDGAATRLELDLPILGPMGTRHTTVLAFVPRQPHPPRAAFVGLNFDGNHATTFDGDIFIPACAERIESAHGKNRAVRGSEAQRWPFRTIIARGYAVATAWYEELETDLPGHAQQGIRGIFDGTSGGSPWGAIGGWAWGLSCMRRAFTDVVDIAEIPVIAVGHSRLGKTALWASAQDINFAGVISNNSGCCGASLFRHHHGEDIRLITERFPHWFTPGLSVYRDADEQIPVDQHQLLALQAPRFTYVTSASEDDNADPQGEYLSTLYASPAFHQFGLAGTLGSSDVGSLVASDPSREEVGAFANIAPNKSIGHGLYYHIRTGGHDMLPEDWGLILDRMDHWLADRQH